MEPGEIDIAPIHDVDCARLREQQVERVNVVQLAIRHVDEAREVAAQVQQRVHLDRRFGGAEMRPRKDRQTKVDRRRVERIDRVGEIETQILIDLQSSRLDDRAKSVLPLFTSASSKIFRKVPDRVQIDTTLNRQNPFKIIPLRAGAPGLTGQQWFGLYGSRHRDL